MNIAFTAVVVGFLVLYGPTARAAAVDAPARPNVLLVTIDNLGYADLGCFGNSLVKTPHIDALAHAGVRCTSFYSGSPTCSPSRASLLTGRYPQRNGLNIQLSGIEGNWGVGLRHSERLLPAYLKAAGYTTGAFGKWNIGFAPGSRPTERGFDEFIGFASGNIDYYTYSYQGKHDLYRGTDELHTGQYCTDLFADSASDFIRRHADRRWFVYLPFNAPHSPERRNESAGGTPRYKVPSEFLALYGAKPDEENERVRYFAVISAMDAAFGRVLRTLDELNLRDNTLVIFYNDNGANTSAEHGMRFAANAPFRGGRPDCWEGGIRVPAIFRWPARLPADTDCDRPLIAMDILPMILRHAGAEFPSDRTLDGTDPTEILAGRAPASDRSLFWEYGSARTRMSAVRHGDFKLIRPAPDRAFELYNLATDPGEFRNVAKRDPEMVARLTAALDRWREDVVRN